MLTAIMEDHYLKIYSTFKIERFFLGWGKLLFGHGSVLDTDPSDVTSSVSQSLCLYTIILFEEQAQNAKFTTFRSLQSGKILFRIIAKVTKNVLCAITNISNFF